MKVVSFLIGMMFFVSNQSLADWSGYIDVGRVEIHVSGVFLAAPIVGLTASGCNTGQTYNYAQFLPSNEKLADRVISSTYYAQSMNKKIKVNIVSCNGVYAVASGIWIE